MSELDPIEKAGQQILGTGDHIKAHIEQLILMNVKGVKGNKMVEGCKEAFDLIDGLSQSCKNHFKASSGANMLVMGLTKLMIEKGVTELELTFNDDNSDKLVVVSPIKDESFTITLQDVH